MKKTSIQDVNDNLRQAMEEYVELGTKVQDEMFKMANQQLDSFRSLTEQALKQQSEFFHKFEENAKRTRELWVKGLDSWRTAIDNCTPKA